MKLLVIDGNSIMNRAFYGIKILTARDGHFTNAIYGFLNIYLSLKETYSPDAVAVAFDLKAPTFRHDVYAEYKAGRKPMPAELFEQMQPLKELLCALGCHIVECKGYEADDILGTLSASCGSNDVCYIATGDRDSLQLVKDNVTVLLTSTKMGRTVTVEYTPEKIYEEYGVSPKGMIEIKALQGDSSDNIPGVAGIGPKTAGELIKKAGTLDGVYASINELGLSEKMTEKLINGKESAYLSRQLGTICLEVPVNTDISEYILKPYDTAKLIRLLSFHEMFKTITRLGLDKNPVEKSETGKNADSVILCDMTEDELLDELGKDGRAYFIVSSAGNEIESLCFALENRLCRVEAGTMVFPSFIKKLFENSKIEKYTSNSKALFTWAQRYATELEAVVMDTALAGYLLNPNASDYSVTALALVYSLQKPDITDELNDGYYASHESTCTDASLLRVLCSKLSSQLEEYSQTELLTGMEIPLARVLSSMEAEGMRVDAGGIRDFGKMLDMKIEEMTRRIYDEAGCEFNINSPKQLGEVLFEKLGIPSKKKTKTGYSTNADVLEELSADYPIVASVLEYRTYSKLKSTYCDGLLKVIDNDGRIHSTFNQTETKTGRLSSSEPNLQNIPVRSELGREMRRFFIADEGNVLVDADYSQIELRILAAISDDKQMCLAFNEGKDIHISTAAEVFGLPVEMVTPVMRSRAKAVNFGIVYGIGAFSLAKDIGVSRAEADRYIKAYLRLYSGVDSYMKKAIESAKTNGYAQTMLHRRRYLPELTSSNANIRAFGERVARNMPIQGTAADIIKIAMINVYKRLKKEKMKAKLIMQVHDELIIEAPENEAEKAAEILHAEMEGAVKLAVRLDADVHIGKTWYDAKG